jgi:hypothetical protein
MLTRKSAVLLLMLVPTLLSAEELVVDTPLAVGSQIGSFDPKYTSIGIRLPGSDRRVWFENTVNGLGVKPYYSPWQDIKINSSANRPTLTFDSRGEFLQPSSLTYDIVTEKLSLQNVILKPNDMRLNFQGQNNTLTLDNSELVFSVAPPVFRSTSSVNLNFVGGDSRIVSGLSDTYDAQWAINVQPSANATIRFAGTAGSSKITEAFRLYGPSSINVDAGSLTFADSYFVQQEGDTRVTNGGSLNAIGANTQVSLDNLSLETGGTLSIGLGSVTVSVSDELVMDDGIARISASAELNVGKLSIAGDSVIIPFIPNGNTRVGSIDVNLLQAQRAQPARLTLSDIALMNVQYFLGSQDLTVDLDNSSLRVAGQGAFSIFELRGAEINVGEGSTLSVFDDQDPRTIYGTINVANRGQFAVGPRFRLVLKPDLDVNLQAGSRMFVLGGLEGSGSLGDGSIFIEEDGTSVGVLAPGDLSNKQPIGAIVTNGYVQFSQSNVPSFADNLVDTGLLDGGVYAVDISVAGGSPQNDQLRYGDGNVRLSTLSHIYVNALDNPSALDLDGKEFTVVQADRAGVAGAILLQNQTVDIVEDNSSIPALIDFIVVDRKTLGHDDVTLVAINRGLNHLTTLAPSSPNTQSLVSGLIQTAVAAPTTTLPSTPTTTINDALHKLTLPQLAQLDNIHVEPFASYQTVILEDYDMVAGTVLGHASGTGLFGGGGMFAQQLAMRSSCAHTNSEQRLRSEGCTSNGFWGSITAVDGKVNGSSGVGSFNYDVGGLVLGADLLMDENKQVGLFAAFNRTKLSEHDAANQNISGNSYHLGAYGAWGTTGGLRLSGVFGYSFGDHESDRMVSDVGAFTGGTAKADFDSRGFYVGTEAAQRLDLNGRFALIPSVSAIFSQTTQRATTESGGGDFNFDLHNNTAKSFLTSIGLTAELQMGDESADWSLLGAAYYYYDWLAANNDFHEITVSNPITGTITQVGQNRGAHGLSLGLGISGQVTKSIAVGAGYVYGWNENGNEHGVSLNFSMTF